MDNSRLLVLRLRTLQMLYRGLANDIANLLDSHNGGTKFMPPEAVEEYRYLAAKRDEVADEIRLLEKLLFDDSDNT
ncbi:MAG: hypothetical protein H6670_07545 [Anaerolineaceae bacterium]|nr:hypothetical protein [Anaerolineaceae bacterium]